MTFEQDMALLDKYSESLNGTPDWDVIEKMRIESDAALRCELPHPDLVLGKQSQSAKAWLAYYIATSMWVNSPSPMTKMVALTDSTLKRLFGVKLTPRLIREARRLAGVKIIKYEGEKMWVRRSETDRGKKVKTIRRWVKD